MREAGISLGVALVTGGGILFTRVHNQISSLDRDITKIKESLMKSQDQLRLVIDHLDGRDD